MEAIIAMPTQLFYTTQIPVSLWFISRNKKQKGKTLFIDARKMGTMVNRRLREMTTEDIAKIAATFEAFDEGKLEDIKGFCAAVTTEDIAKQDYILTPGRYVGIEEQEDDGGGLQGRDQAPDAVVQGQPQPEQAQQDGEEPRLSAMRRALPTAEA